MTVDSVEYRKQTYPLLRSLVSMVAFLLIIIVSTSTCFAVENIIRVVSPVDGVWVAERKLYVAGVITGPAQTVKISGIGKVQVKDGGVFGDFISLDRGLNKIEFKAGKDKVEINVFYTADVKKRTPPSGFKPFYVHPKPSALRCEECHRFKKGAFNFKRLIPTQANCTTECHQDIGRAKHVHGPVGAGVCISCHSPHGTLNPSFVPQEGGALCTSCHQAREDEFAQEVLHPPLEEGCSECHNPHESPNRYQLNYDGDSLSSLCFTCHDDGVFMEENQHSPVEEGDCIACHRPHSSSNSYLLIEPLEGGTLCFECHEDQKEDFEMEFIHAPVEESCTGCHDPHSAKAGYMLKKEGGELCAMCHQDETPQIYEAINSATTEHPPVSEGQCIKCHRPHSSNQSSLLSDSMENLCFSCHTDLGEIVSESTNRHGPVKTGDCTACHDVHGSQFTKLLARYYPDNFYSSYSKNKYDLCFGCHNVDMARTASTTSLTSFRDGDYNLHYFHVNNEKGRTCTACHDPHASSQAKHIRYEVPFGAWSYPINITKTATGGTCVVGCHSPKQYDRQNPQLGRK